MPETRLSSTWCPTTCAYRLTMDMDLKQRYAFSELNFADTGSRAADRGLLRPGGLRCVRRRSLPACDVLADPRPPTSTLSSASSRCLGLPGRDPLVLSVLDAQGVPDKACEGDRAVAHEDALAGPQCAPMPERRSSPSTLSSLSGFSRPRTSKVPPSSLSTERPPGLEPGLRPAESRSPRTDAQLTPVPKSAPRRARRSPLAPRSARAPACLELYAGRPRLTSALVEQGLRCVPPLELARGPQFEIHHPGVFRQLRMWITQRKLWYIHLGTPCTYYVGRRHS